MSKCCKQYYEPCCDYGYGGGSYSNIYSLLILILIVCQFCKKGKWWGRDEECEEEEHGLIDNSILFIIAIFILVYCSCGKGFFGGNNYGCC